MAVNLRVLVPDATRNYVQNPSLHIDTTGWNSSGATVSRVFDYARFGFTSLKVVTAGLALREGAFYRVNDLVGISEPITGSAYVRGSGQVRLRLIDNPAGKEWLSDKIYLRSDRWQRAEVTGYSTGSNDVRLYIETPDRVSALTFYVDGAQIERHPYSTTYCDGDQDGCSWDGTAHVSKSSRLASTREGGRWLDLAGVCRESSDIYATVLTGFGDAPIESQVDIWTQEPGGFIQGTRARDRTVIVRFQTKNPSPRHHGAPDRTALHELRQQLVDVFKPDLTDQNQTMRLEYSQGSRSVYLDVIYDGGLEGEWDIRNQWTDSFVVSFKAVDPIFREDSQDVTALPFRRRFAKAAKYINLMAKIDGEWSVLSPDGTGYVPATSMIGAMARGPRGQLYVAGTEIGVWEAGVYTRLGTVAGFAGATGWCNAIAVHPNGDVYVGGKFLSINGVAANRVGRWRPGVGWNVLSPGLDGEVMAICVAQNGQVFFGGDINGTSGLTIVSQGIIRWDGSQWQPVAPPGADFRVVQVIRRGWDLTTLFIGGGFSATYLGVSYNRVAQINCVTMALSQMGGGIPKGAVTSMLVAPDGSVYVGGTFYEDAWGNDLNRVAYYTGGGWFSLGEIGPPGAGDAGFALGFTDLGDILYVGAFEALGASFIRNIALWNGDRRALGKWSGLDILTPLRVASGPGASQPYTTDVQVYPNGDIYLSFWDSAAGWDGISWAETADVVTVTNTGTMAVHPVLRVTGPGRLRTLENRATRAMLHFDLLLSAGEIVTIDFGGATITSTTRGDITGKLLPIGSLRDFYLTPGENKIGAFMTDDIGGTMYLAWTPQHWSADAVAAGELR